MRKRFQVFFRMGKFQRLFLYADVLFSLLALFCSCVEFRLYIFSDISLLLLSISLPLAHLNKFWSAGKAIHLSYNEVALKRLRHHVETQRFDNSIRNSKHQTQGVLVSRRDERTFRFNDNSLSFQCHRNSNNYFLQLFCSNQTKISHI